MNKVTVILLALGMILSLCACGANSQSDQSTASGEKVEAATQANDAPPAVSINEAALSDAETTAEGMADFNFDTNTVLLTRATPMTCPPT